MRFSASKVSLALRCRHWLTLDPPATPAGDAAENGTRIHALIQHWLETGDEPGPGESWFPAFRDWFDSHAPLDLVTCEMAFAWSPSHGGRLLGTDLGRDYSGARDYEAVGTADAVWCLDDRVVVWDWKTGSTRYGSPERWGQLAALAVMAADHFGKRHADVAYVYVGEDGTRCDHAELDAVALNEHRDALARLLESDRSPNPGPWCHEMWCPAVGVCEAVHAEAAELVPDVPLARLARGVVDPESLAAWLEVKPRFDALRKELDAQASALLDASGGCVDLPDGGRWVRQECQRRSFDAAKAKALLGDRAAECERVTTYTRNVRRAG